MPPFDRIEPIRYKLLTSRIFLDIPISEFEDFGELGGSAYKTIPWPYTNPMIGGISQNSKYIKSINDTLGGGKIGNQDIIDERFLLEAKNNDEVGVNIEQMDLEQCRYFNTGSYDIHALLNIPIEDGNIIEDAGGIDIQNQTIAQWNNHDEDTADNNTTVIDHGDGRVTLQVDGSAGNSRNDIQWYSTTGDNGLYITEGMPYTVKFEIMATADRDAKVFLNERNDWNEDDWNFSNLGLQAIIPITTEFVEHTFTFNASDVCPKSDGINCDDGKETNPGGASFSLHLGNESDNGAFDNIDITLRNVEIKTATYGDYYVALYNDISGSSTQTSGYWDGETNKFSEESSVGQIFITENQDLDLKQSCKLELNTGELVDKSIYDSSGNAGKGLLIGDYKIKKTRKGERMRRDSFIKVAKKVGNKDGAL